MASTATEINRPARECGCPDWFVRCSHWSGEIVFLGDRRRLRWVNGQPDEVDVSPWRVWRILSADWLAHKLLNHSITTPDLCLYAGDSEADALAAFAQAELELLRADDA